MHQSGCSKSSPNNKLTLYLCSRDLVIENGIIDKLRGVLCVDPDIVESKKVYGQVTLTFRYGREDEEVMGLKFCNEAVMCLAQLYPPVQSNVRGNPNTPLQDALLQRLGSRAHAFSMELTPLAPPSVQLVPAKEYRGAPIGTSYDCRAYIAECTDTKQEKKTTVRMGIRVVQGAGVAAAPSGMAASCSPGPAPARDSRLMRLSPKNFKASSSPGRRPSSQLRPPVLPEETNDENPQEPPLENTADSERERKVIPPPFCLPAPRASVDKPFLLSDGRVALEASLDKGSYSHGEPVKVNVAVNNSSHKTVRRVKVFVVQHVDVCMFSNGKFKNVVALTTSRDECPVGPGGTLDSSYILRPARGTTKNWIALEDSYSKNGASLASTVISSTNAPEERNVFAIYVSYYVKVKLSLSAMGGELSLKLPFTLTHSCREEEPMSPNANILNEGIADEIISDCNDQNIQNSNMNKRESLPIIKYNSKEIINKTDADEMQIGSIITENTENIEPGKIIVSVEDHPPPSDVNIRNKYPEEAIKLQAKMDMLEKKKTIGEEDMNLISNYDSDCT